MSRRAKRAAAAFLLLGLTAAAVRLVLPAVPGWFISADPLSACDVIIVSGSNPAGSTEVEGVRLWRRELGSTAEGQTATAGRAAMEGRPYLLCVGRPAAWRVAEDDVMARHARELGVPAERVLRFHIPFSTAADAGTMREEARLLLPFLQARGFKSALVVSAELQSRRKSLIVRRWREAGIRVLVHPIRGPEFRPDGWWRRKRDTKAVVAEALGWLTLPFGH